MNQPQKVDLAKSSFHPILSTYENFRTDLLLPAAKHALIGQPIHRHLILPTDTLDKFLIVFVGHAGRVQHSFLKLINHERSIFLNCAPSHIGSLTKVIRDVMNAEFFKSQGR